MAQSQLPIESFPAWALLNNVVFSAAELRNVEGKGFGLASKRAIVNSDGDGPVEILKIPHDLVLSAEAIEDYAKVDQNFKQLLEVAGHQSTRKDIMLYLLTHLVLSKRDQSTSKGGASTPWTEYIKFLPRTIPVPTMWSEDERQLLRGTSLESSLNAKLSTLMSEFEQLHEKSSELPFYKLLFWEKETARLEDWILVDAWYRSRCLELPLAGHAMVPGLDMANHSQNATAYYDENHDGDVVLLKRPGSFVSEGGEITISYGDAKSAAEMLFSYGFVNKDSPGHELILHLNILDDDPLGKAKLHIFQGSPNVRLSLIDKSIKWDSAFVYFMCLNEEDGLEFRVLQDTAGTRQLKLFWQDEDVSERARDFETLIQTHPLCQVFKLRAVAVLEERVAMQLEKIKSEISHKELEPSRTAGGFSVECIGAVELLRDVETKILEAAVESLGDEKANLFKDAHVVAYLGLTEDTQNDQVSGEVVSNEEDDFS